MASGDPRDPLRSPRSAMKKWGIGRGVPCPSLVGVRHEVSRPCSLSVKRNRSK